MLRIYSGIPAFMSSHSSRGQIAFQFAQLSLYSGNSEGRTMCRRSGSSVGMRSGNLTPSRWSDSCCAIRATKSKSLYSTLVPVRSKASSVTLFERSTLPQIFPHDQQPSRPGTNSSDCLVNLGFIRTCKFCGLFEPSAVTSIVIMRLVTPSCVAAKPIICLESCLLWPFPAESSSIRSITPCTKGDSISLCSTLAATVLSIWLVGSTNSRVFGSNPSMFSIIVHPAQTDSVRERLTSTRTKVDNTSTSCNGRS